MPRADGLAIAGPIRQRTRQFIRALAAALDLVMPGLAEVASALLTDEPPSDQQGLMQLLWAIDERLASTPATASPHMLLVIDNLHVLQSTVVNAMILHILEHGPEHLHLLMLARGRRNLALANLYAHHKIIEITTEDLRFTHDELAEYLQKRDFEPPDETMLAQITERSQGWIGALQLAYHSLSPPYSTADLLNALHGGNYWLAEYLKTEILDRQNSTLCQFLLQTSILKHFNVELCAAITQTSDAYAALATIQNEQLFLIPLNAENGWYCYHPLFQELLQHQLKIEIDAHVVADLHVRAAHWLADNNQTEAAVDHFLAAGKEQEAIALVEQKLQNAIRQGESQAKELLSLLPEQVLHRSPRLMSDRCFLAALANGENLMGYAKETEAALQNWAAPTADYSRLQSELHLWFAVAHFHHGDLEIAANRATQAEAHSHHLPNLALGTLSFLQMHLRRYAGEHEQMMAYAQQAQGLFRQAQFSLGALAVHRELARWHMRSGRSKEATQHFQAICNAWDYHQYSALSELIWTYLCAAENSYWQNDLEQAHSYQQTALKLANQLEDEALMLIANRLGLLLMAVAQDVDIQLEEFRAESAQTKGKKLWHILNDLECRLLIAAGHMEQAWHIVQWAGVDLMAKPHDYNSRMLIPYLRAYIARGVDLATVTPVLDGAIAHRAAIGNHFDELQLLALLAWQQIQLYGAEMAAETLTQARQMALQTGYERVLLDIPALNSLGFQTAKGALAPDIPSTLLTSQEYEVLKLLAANYTYQKIADEIFISINTVRTHVRHIYKKLKVSRREQAIEAAHRQGLLTITSTIK